MSNPSSLSSLGPSVEVDGVVITDPRTGEVVGRVAWTSPAEVAATITRAEAAWWDWRRRDPAERGRMLHQAAAAVLEHEAELAQLNTRETGRPYEQALAGVRAGADTLAQYAELGPLHAGRSLGGAATNIDYTVSEARGVVAVVTPWNDPVAVSTGLIGAALVTGNTVVFKPSERAPHVGMQLGSILAGAFPEFVLQTIVGDADTGMKLIMDNRVAVIAHVGSSQAGERIARTAALTGAHVIRENGGNDALIVDADVDPVWAAHQAAVGAFTNAGQLCTSVERIYLHQAVEREFTAALIAEARTLNESGELGPLVDRALRTIVHNQVSEAVSDGATVRTGGHIPVGPGAFYPATVLTGCRSLMTLMREETFGPVAPIQLVTSFDEGLQLAVHDRYGLAATVLTRSMDHAHAAIADLPVGTVKVNNVFGGAPGGSAQPRGLSGAGFGYGPGLLDELTLTKVVHVTPAP